MRQVYVVKGFVGSPLVAFVSRENAETVTDALDVTCSIEAVPLCDATDVPEQTYGSLDAWEKGEVEDA